MHNDMHTHMNNDMSMMYSVYAFGIYNKDTVSLYVLFPLWGSIILHHIYIIIIYIIFIFMMIYTYPGQSRKPDSKPHAISKQYHSGGVLKTIPHKEVDFGATQLKHQKYHNFVGLQCYHINS